MRGWYDFILSTPNAYTGMESNTVYRESFVMWDTIKGMFTGSISGLVDSIGNAIDKNVTSDEERLALKNQLKSIGNDAQKEAHRHVEGLESQITDRHANDMKSDSWLSKNVRPLALVFLTVSITILAFITTLDSPVCIEGVCTPSVDNQILKYWIDLFTTLLGLVYTFYFGSRGIEKIASIMKGK